MHGLNFLGDARAAMIVIYFELTPYSCPNLGKVRVTKQRSYE